jgi:signal transduction histidine kinase
MNMITMASQPKTRAVKTIDTELTAAHDNWMADADRFLLPVTDTGATFWDRWAAVRYVEEQLATRLDSERALLQHLRPFLPAEVRERLGMQAERLTRLVEDFNFFGRRRESAREIAHTARELTEALRLWYAEIELASSGIRLADVSREGTRLLTELDPRRCGWADANRS